MYTPKNTLYVCKHRSTGTINTFHNILPGEEWEVQTSLVPKEEYDVLAKRLEQGYGSGLSTTTEAFRYAQIHKAVDAMGGFANFSAWVNEHAKDYFASLEKALAIIQLFFKNEDRAVIEARAMLDRYAKEIS